MKTEMELTAYHEAAHAVVATNFSFVVIDIGISEGAAGARINFGIDKKLLSMLFNYSDFNMRIGSFPKVDSNVLKFIILTMIAGQIAESLLKYPGSTNLEFSDSMLPNDDVAIINSLLTYAKDYKIELPSLNFSIFAKECYDILMDPKVWSRVEQLAKVLLNKNYISGEESLQVIG